MNCLLFEPLQKADKREMDNRVLKKDFQTACGELSQNINDYMQKFDVHVGLLQTVLVSQLHFIACC